MGFLGTMPILESKKIQISNIPEATERFENWCTENYLVLNVNKSEAAVFTLGEWVTTGR